MTEWNGVLETVVSTVGADEAGTVCIFEFLKALPQEIAEAQNTPFIVRRPQANKPYGVCANPTFAGQY